MFKTVLARCPNLHTALMSNFSLMKNYSKLFLFKKLLKFWIAYCTCAQRSSHCHSILISRCLLLLKSLIFQLYTANVEFTRNSLPLGGKEHWDILGGESRKFEFKSVFQSKLVNFWHISKIIHLLKAHKICRYTYFYIRKSNGLFDFL